MVSLSNWFYTFDKFYLSIFRDQFWYRSISTIILRMIGTIVLKLTNDIEVCCWCYKREITFRLISCIFQKRWIWIITSNSKICVKKLKCKSYIFRFSGIQFTEFCQHSLFGNLVVCHLTFSEWPRGWFTQCYKNRISRDTVKKILCFLCKQWKIDELGIIKWKTCSE